MPVPNGNVPEPSLEANGTSSVLSGARSVQALLNFRKR